MRRLKKDQNFFFMASRSVLTLNMFEICSQARISIIKILSAGKKTVDTSLLVTHIHDPTSITQCTVVDPGDSEAKNRIIMTNLADGGINLVLKLEMTFCQYLHFLEKLPRHKRFH